MELSLNSVVGFTTPGTIKMKGTIANQEVVVLIDYGAMHNFIVERIVDWFNLSMTETPTMVCQWGLGKQSKEKGFARQ